MIELLIKDFKIEFRRKFEILASLSFVLVSALILSQASFFTTKVILIPSFYIVVVFIAVFTSTTSFVREKDSKTLEGLMLLPIHPSTIFVAKTIFSFILITIQGSIELFFLAIFSNNTEILNLFPTFLVFSLYMAVVSAFSSALVMFSEGRGFLIPMVVFIFTIPVVSTLMSGNLVTLLIETFSVSLAIVSLSTYLFE
ncbi:ABC transporter permease subunit [Archaeoglobus sp.]